ncbi:MAG: hypothetical protein R6U27_06370 [Desulfobacterales bacterium]
MNLKNKLAILKEIYRLYEQFLEDYTFVCQKYCADCCTCNVTLTTLEGYYLVDNLFGENKTEYLLRLKNSAEKRFQPKYTFNKIAAIFAQGKDIEEEQCDPSWGRCPFLDKSHCIFYTFRPFGCRCMVSTSCCKETGFAKMPPLVITANNVFMQFIEHVDSNGYSGNFADVLKWIGDENNRKGYAQDQHREPYQSFAKNMPLPVLMVPPEHRTKLVNLLSALNSLLL